jgi:thioredoxin reductase/ferredoxin
MLDLLRRYADWLHLRWPGGTVEKLPVVEEDGSTRVPGLYVVGDLTGIPLLKFSADTGARAVRTIAEDPAFQALRGDGGDEVLDLVIVGGGVSGMAAALEAQERGLSFALLEGSEPFSTLVNFPKGKPIYTYPTEMTPAGKIQFEAQVKEPLLEELRAQTAGIEPRRLRADHVARDGRLLRVVVAGDGDDLRARRVIVGIGRSGNFRKLGVPGEDRDKVSNRLHDPNDFAGQDVLVVGGGDSALEAAVALTQGGARVTLSYRKPDLVRPKPENVAKLFRLAEDPTADVQIANPASQRVTTTTGRYLKVSETQGTLDLELGTQVQEIGAETVTLKRKDDDAQELPNQAVFSMIGREAPLDFFRRSGVPIRGEVRGAGWATLALVLLAFTALYAWKKEALFPADAGDWPKSMPALLSGLGLGDSVKDRSSLVSVIAYSARSPSFYYTLLYCTVMLVFGVRRIRRRKTPYVKVQTASLLAIQFLPLFLLPELLLPWLGVNGFFSDGAALQGLADELFPKYGAGLSDTNPPPWGHPRAYWRAYGLILAWPLNVYNVFTAQPQVGWLVISFVQTFVLLPLLVWRWGKGAYCGWICSCGGMAETLGDAHRHKMPHGPGWNRLNFLGQAILALAFLILALRIAGWVMGKASWPAEAVSFLLSGEGGPTKYLSYEWVVDILLAGILGFGLYFHFSGRMWCRFACPLAALMHIYARFSQFRILAEKKKCISCNVCTSVCHQGIDIMSFANKGLPMEDPECVRCSACVQSCPTGVLRFGRVDRQGNVLGYDGLAASPVQMAEQGKKLPVV